MKLTYPIVLEPEEEGGYTVTAPDLPGLVTFGSTLDESLAMAIDAASGWVLTELEDGKPAPEATPLHQVHTDDSRDLTTLILLDMDAYAEQYGNRAVRKNVTIPAWLDTWASKAGVNYSHTLRNALESEYKRATARV